MALGRAEILHSMMTGIQPAVPTSGGKIVTQARPESYEADPGTNDSQARSTSASGTASAHRYECHLRAKTAILLNRNVPAS